MAWLLLIGNCCVTLARG